MDYRDRVFEGGTVLLDSNTFTGCTFRNCVLVFEAAAPPNLGANRFQENVVLVLKGHAAALPHLLSMLCERGGEGGRQIVKQLCDAILDGGYEQYSKG